MINANECVATLVEILASGLASDMAKNDAENYAAFTLDGCNGEKFLALFVKMPDGKTPMQLQAEAEEEIDRLKKIMDDRGINY